MLIRVNRLYHRDRQIKTVFERVNRAAKLLASKATPHVTMCNCTLTETVTECKSCELYTKKVDAFQSLHCH